MIERNTLFLEKMLQNVLWRFTKSDPRDSIYSWCRSNCRTYSIIRSHMFRADMIIETNIHSYTLIHTKYANESLSLLLWELVMWQTTGVCRYASKNTCERPVCVWVWVWVCVCVWERERERDHILSLHYWLAGEFNQASNKSRVCCWRIVLWELQLFVSLKPLWTRTTSPSHPYTPSSRPLLTNLFAYFLHLSPLFSFSAAPKLTLKKWHKTD